MRKICIAFLFLTFFTTLFSTIITQDWNTTSIPTGWEVGGYKNSTHDINALPGDIKSTAEFLGSGSGFGYLRLTENAGNQRGWAYYKNSTLNILGKWSIDLEIRIGKAHDGSNITNGADGLAIVFLEKGYVEDDSNNFDAGQITGGIGEWQGAPHQANSSQNGYHADEDFLGYSFEWDHYRNSGEVTLEYNHWVDLKNWAHSGFGKDMGNDSGYYYNDGWRHCRLSSNGSGLFTFQYSNNDDADFNGSFTFSPGATSNGDPTYESLTEDYLAYVGFTAGTGGQTAYHEIRNVEIRTGDDALPVTLSSFTAAYINNSSVLNWTTQSESENSGWNIMRSNSTNLDEAFLVNTNQILGQGTTSEPTNYIYEDSSDLLQDHTYWYWLESISYSGASQYFGPIGVEITSEENFEDTPEIGQKTGLLPNYPNPFNPVTMFMFNLAEDEVAERLEIYNMKGQKVDVISNPENPQSWEGKDSKGQELASGIYTYILFTNKAEYTRKMVLTK